MGTESHNRDSFLDHLRRVLASCLIFFPAFILSVVFLQGLVALACKALGYRVKFTYNKIYVNPNDWHFWSRLRIDFAYGIPPFVCLIGGLLLLSQLIRIRNEINLFRAFRLWFMFCLINLFLSQLLIGPIGLYENHIMGFYQTFAVVGSWYYLPVGVMAIFAVLSVAASLVFGSFVRNEVLKFSGSSRGIKSSSGKGAVIFQLFILPVILCFIPIATVCTKDYFFPSVFFLLNFMIIAAGMYTKSIFDNSMVRCGKDDPLNHWPVFELIIALAVWAGIFFNFK